MKAAAVQNANQCYCIIYDEKISTTQMSLDHFFQRVDRVEPSKEPEPVPSVSGMNETAARLHLLLLTTLQLYRLTSRSSHSMPAPVCHLLYCTIICFNIL